MFRNKSAWFSSSVSQARQNFWTLEGGSFAHWREAEYLFSDDASWPDTLRIFESKDYLWKKVVVFHSRFLSVCEMRESVKSVCIGHYVLPPASVQDEVRSVVGRFIWDCETEQSVDQSSYKSFSCSGEDENRDAGRSSSKRSDTDSWESIASQGYHNPDWNKLKGYVSMDSLPKYSGDLHDFHGCFRCVNCKAHCHLQHT